MKRIEAIIRPEKMEDVKQGLIDLGHAGLTVYSVQGHGIQKGIRQRWRGQDYVVDLLPKVAVVVMVDDQEVETIVDAIRHHAEGG